VVLMTALADARAKPAFAVLRQRYAADTNTMKAIDALGKQFDAAVKPS
jgi:hypothetical protein